MKKKSILKKIYEYCKRTIWEFDDRERIAWGLMDRMRCPLSMVDSSLYDEITDCIGDYCEEHNLDADDYDAEEVFFAI